mgnify:CR=1 FL=1
MKRHIPNIITLCNLLCGVFAVIVATTQFASLEWSVVLIFCGAIFDFFDGFTARLLKVSSPIGKELDSLADLVTFGFAPAAITSGIIQHLLYVGTLPENEELTLANYAIVFFPYIIVAFSALRLAKFNIDERQTCSFIGLPTPANAIFFASFALIPDLDYIPVWLIEGLVLVFSILLISEIPMFSLKFKNYDWAENKIRYIFLICAVILLLCLQLQALTYIILCYIIISVVNNIITAKEKRN